MAVYNINVHYLLCKTTYSHIIPKFVPISKNKLHNVLLSRFTFTQPRHTFQAQGIRQSRTLITRDIIVDLVKVYALDNSGSHTISGKTERFVCAFLCPDRLWNPASDSAGITARDSCPWCKATGASS